MALLDSTPSGIIWFPRTRTLAFGFCRRIHLGNPCTIGQVIWRCGFSLPLPLKAKRGLQTDPNHRGSLVAHSPGRHPRPDAPKGRYRDTDGIATENKQPSFKGPPFWGGAQFFGWSLDLQHCYVSGCHFFFLSASLRDPFLGSGLGCVTGHAGHSIHERQSP